MAYKKFTKVIKRGGRIGTQRESVHEMGVSRGVRGGKKEVNNIQSKSAIINQHESKELGRNQGKKKR